MENQSLLLHHEISLARETIRASKRCLRAGTPHIELLEAQQASMGQHSPWAVLPSSFNPPTLAHREMVRWAKKSGGFDGALLLLDLRHADKPMEYAHLVDRILMVRLAFQDQGEVLVGIASHGLFLEKAQPLEMLFPENASWSFLIGEDTLARILDHRFYKDPESELRRLFCFASFVVFQRPGWENASSICPFRDRMRMAYLPKRVQHISSSSVRNNRSLGLPWKHLVCPKVADFINRTGLYLPEPTPYASRREALERLFPDG